MTIIIPLWSQYPLQDWAASLVRRYVVPVLILTMTTQVEIAVTERVLELVSNSVNTNKLALPTKLRLLYMQVPYYVGTLMQYSANNELSTNTDQNGITYWCSQAASNESKLIPRTIHSQPHSTYEFLQNKPMNDAIQETTHVLYGVAHLLIVCLHAYDYNSF